jgi:uncharacterized protein (TIGR03083 family)
MLDLQSSREAIVREWDKFITRLQSAPDIGWDTAVRCEGWGIADLVAHVAWGISMEADALSRMREGISDPATGVVQDPGAKREALLEVVTSARDQLYNQLEQLTLDDMSKTAPMPYGPTPVPFVLQVFVMEAGVHSNDLAAAMGQPEELAEDVIAATAIVLGGSLPLLAQASKEVPSSGITYRLTGNNVSMDLANLDGGWMVGPIETEPDCQISASDSDLILFAMGRITSEHTGLTITGDRDMAASFKAYFPGP